MFDLGLQELIVIFAVALVVFGPKRLPELGRTVGRGLRELKRAMSDIKSEVDREMDGLGGPPEIGGGEADGGKAAGREEDK